MYVRASLKTLLLITVSIFAVGDFGDELIGLQYSDVQEQKSGDAEQPTLLEYSGRQPFQRLEADQPAVEMVLSAELASAGRYEVPFFATAASENQLVADIGCGSGKFAIQLVAAVGENGMVYCRDIDKAALETLRESALRKQLSNLDIAVSEKNNVTMPDDSIDLALLSDGLSS